ncbi:unnamed protein product [Arctogadus glacialis]
MRTPTQRLISWASLPCFKDLLKAQSEARPPPLCVCGGSGSSRVEIGPQQQALERGGGGRDEGPSASPSTQDQDFKDTRDTPPPTRPSGDENWTTGRSGAGGEQLERL